MKRTGWLTLFILSFFSTKVFCQQDVTFHINQQLLTGKNVLKAKRDIFDQYVWVLTQNNGVFRINSQTFAIDDYTATFATYSSDQFIDISGYDNNDVFVATNTNVVAFEKGVFSTIGTAQGLTGTVNSIGMGDAGGVYPPGHLLIGDSDGLGDYNIASNTLYLGKYTAQSYGPTKVFAATYRTQMFTNVNYDFYNASNYPTVIFTPFQGYASYIYHTSGIDNKINTANYILVSTFGIGVYNGSSFWGNENGLFQQSLHWDGLYPTTTFHFLDGIQVNAISDIFGLTSFTDGSMNPPIEKDNLLVGTNNGLYFSNSLYNNTNPGVSEFSLFHYDELGNVSINDISVNAVTTVTNSQNVVCENGVWVSTTNGLYYIIPDYAAYLDTKIQLVNGIYFTQPVGNNSSSIDLCSGSSVSMSFNPYLLYDNSIQWQKNGQDIVGQSSTTLSVNESGDYSAIVYDPCENVSLSTNHLKVTTVSGPAFTFNYPPTIQNCNTNPVTLTVTGDASYQYRWYTNGVLNGNTTQSLTVTQSGQYYVEVSACPNSWVPSSMVQVSLVNLPVPAITGDKPTYCQGDAATLSANVTVDPSYTINWYLDNVLLTADNNLPQITTNSAGNYSVTISSNISTCTSQSVGYPLSFTPPPAFTFDYPATLNYCAGNTVVLKVQGSAGYQYEWFKEGALIADVNSNELPVSQNGSYSVQVSACPGNWVPGPNAVQVNFIATPIPVITTDKQAYCQGDNAILSINNASDPTLTVYWYKDNVRLPGDDGDFIISTNVAGTYTAAIVSSYTDPNGTPCSSTSNPVAISFSAPQHVSIQEITDNGLCAGQTVSLKAIYTDGSVQWSTGETSDQISVTTSGTYSVTLTTPSGCQTNEDITIAFLPDPVLAKINDAPLCVDKKETVTLTAPPGFAQYNWNNQNGGQTYTVSQPQAVNLIVTDANGCQAAEKINVYAQCPDVEIPNTFTPNGDNINDTWIIEGLDNTATVSIFTRYGTQIYKSTNGYTTPWDGTYSGKKVASGAYYYIITNKNGKEKYSGFVMVVY